MTGYILAIVGILASAVGFYIAASFTLAQKQLLAATRLQAYLRHYGRLMTDYKADAIFSLGEAWEKEEQAIIQRGGSEEELKTLSNEKRKLWEQVGEAVKNPDVVPESMFASVTDMVSHVKKTDIPNMQDSLKVGRQNILTGLTFITDEEATYMGVYVAGNAIALKMGIIELMDGLVYLVARSVESQDAVDPKNFMAEFTKLLWRGMNVSRDYCKLQRECQIFTNHTVAKLTWRNIKQGSRINRR